MNEMIMVEDPILELLIDAAKTGRVDVIQDFVSKPRGPSVIRFLETLFEINLEFLESLLAINLNAQDGSGKTLLIHAAENGQLEVVQFLLGQPETYLYVEDNLGKNALIYAVENNQLEILQLLFTQAENDDDVQNGNIKKEAFLYAAISGSLEVIQFFLTQSEIDLYAEDSLGKTALCYAAANGQVEVVRFFLNKSGIDPNVQDQAGKTALFHAILGKHALIAETLIQAGANLKLRDAEGNDALFYAEANLPLLAKKIIKMDIVEFITRVLKEFNYERQEPLCEVRQEKVGELCIEISFFLTHLMEQLGEKNTELVDAAGNFLRQYAVFCGKNEMNSILNNFPPPEILSRQNQQFFPRNSQRQEFLEEEKSDEDECFVVDFSRFEI